VYNNAAISRSAGTFQPAAFEITLPEETPDKLPQVQLSIDNVDKSMSTALRTLTGRVNVMMEVVLASSPNTIEVGPFTFQLMSCSYDAEKLTGVLGLEDDLLNTAFPGATYTPANSPGLFS
jgi:hypothetical protein